MKDLDFFPPLFFPPFPGEMDLGSGITFDIFTHGKPRVVFFWYFIL